MLDDIEVIDLSNVETRSTPAMQHFTGMGIDGTKAGKVTLTARGSKGSSSLAALRARHGATSIITTIHSSEASSLTATPAPSAPVVESETHNAPAKKRKTEDVNDDVPRKSAKTSSIKSAGEVKTSAEPRKFKHPSSIESIRKIVPTTELSLRYESNQKQTPRHMKSTLPRGPQVKRRETVTIRPLSRAATAVLQYTDISQFMTLFKSPSANNDDSRDTQQLISPSTSEKSIESSLFCTPPPVTQPPTTPPPPRRAQYEHKKLLKSLQNAPKKSPPRNFRRSAYAEAARHACDDTDDEEVLPAVKSEDGDDFSGSTVVDDKVTSRDSSATLASSDLWTAICSGTGSKDYGAKASDSDPKLGMAAPCKPSSVHAVTRDAGFGPSILAPISRTPAIQALIARAPRFQAPGFQATQQLQTRHTAQQTAQTTQLQQAFQALLSNLTSLSQVPALLAAQQAVHDSQLRTMEEFNAELHRRLQVVENEQNRIKNGTFSNEMFEKRVADVEKDQVDVKKWAEDQCHVFVGGTNRGFTEQSIKLDLYEKELEKMKEGMAELKRMKKKD